MNYKFFASHYARMCSEQVDVSNYWPFVKGQKVTPEEQILISDLMYECSRIQTDKRMIFDMNKFDSIDNDTFIA